MPDSKIHIEYCQVKSIEKAKLLAHHLDQIEKEIGIKSVLISMRGVFVCPDIDLTQLTNSTEPMEKILGRLFIKMHIKTYGKNSKYKKLK